MKTTEGDVIEYLRKCTDREVLSIARKARKLAKKEEYKVDIIPFDNITEDSQTSVIEPLPGVET